MVYDLHWNAPSRHTAPFAPEALIVVLAVRNEEKEAEAFRRNWQAGVPRAEFVGLPIEVAGLMNAEDLTRRLSEAASRRGLSPERTVLLGTGIAGRAALDLLLQAHVPSAGMLAMDVALWPPPRSCMPSKTMVRMIQHQRPDDPEWALYFALVDEVRRTMSDIRHAMLEPRCATTVQAMSRAGVGYLAELVAHASRHPTSEAAS